MPARYAIAQVTPYPWEDAHEVNAYVGALARELTERGHRVLIVAPSRSPELVRDSRRRIRNHELFDPSGAPSVLAVGELLPTMGPRRAVPSLPVDIARTIEELLSTDELDVVHVHEPFAPSASSAALRHSRALNVATFHMPAERACRRKSRGASWTRSSGAWMPAWRRSSRRRSCCSARFPPATR